MKRCPFTLLAITGVWLLAMYLPGQAEEPQKSPNVSQEQRFVVTLATAAGTAQAGVAQEDNPGDQQDQPKEGEKKESEASNNSQPTHRFRIQLLQPGAIVWHEQSSGKERSSAIPSAGVVAYVVADNDSDPKQIEIRILEPSGDPRKSEGVLSSKQSIQIQIVPGQPAHIVIQKDGQSWSVDENQLDKLPQEIRSVYDKRRELVEELRKQIEQLRKQQTELFRLPEGAKPEGPHVWRQLVIPAMPPVITWTRPGDTNLSERLERVEKELTEIRKQLDALGQLTEEIRALRKSLEKKEE